MILATLVHPLTCVSHEPRFCLEWHNYTCLHTKYPAPDRAWKVYVALKVHISVLENRNPGHRMNPPNNKHTSSFPPWRVLVSLFKVSEQGAHDADFSCLGAASCVRRVLSSLQPGPHQKALPSPALWMSHKWWHPPIDHPFLLANDVESLDPHFKNTLLCGAQRGDLLDEPKMNLHYAWLDVSIREWVFVELGGLSDRVSHLQCPVA